MKGEHTLVVRCATSGFRFPSYMHGSSPSHDVDAKSVTDEETVWQAKVKGISHHVLNMHIHGLAIYELLCSISAIFAVLGFV